MIVVKIDVFDKISGVYQTSFKEVFSNLKESQKWCRDHPNQKQSFSVGLAWNKSSGVLFYDAFVSEGLVKDNSDSVQDRGGDL